MKNLNELAKDIYQANKEKGFWDSEKNIGEMLMLVVSELSEALEADRKGKRANIAEFRKMVEGSQYDSTGYILLFRSCIKDTFEDEIADAMIRLFDLAGGLGIDLDFHVEQKLRYNKTRPFKHGKNY